MLPESFLTELKYNSDIEQTVSSYVNLKRAGRNLKGLCPFHSEKSPSFTVYPESQSFYCFGCGAGGDVVTFIRKIENLEYIEAVKFLAQRAGMAMPEDVQNDNTARQKARILEMNKEAARFFHNTLKSPQGQVGLDYLKNRGLTAKIVTRFGLGYAPDSWDSLRNHLRTLGYSYEEMAEAALVQRRRDGNSYYDAFRGRVMFPIIDLRGNVIAFGGRILGEGGPKYLNSGDTLVFKKSRNLFALNIAKSSREETLILAEGYMDVIAIHQAGFDNAVATLGTALTPEQARLIAQYCKEVVIAYDSDGAGQAATRRAINLFDETGVKVKVLSFEDAKDPDEYIKKFGPQRFKMLLSGSANAVEYEIDKIKAKYDCNTDAGKVGFLGEFATLMAGIRNPIERDVYIGRNAQELGVSKDAVLAQVVSIQKRRNKTQEKRQQRDLKVYSQEVELNRKDRQRSQNLKYALAEDKLIALLLKNPDFNAEIRLRIGPEDFVTDLNRQIFEAICERMRQDLSADTLSLGQILGEEAVSRLSWILASSDTVGQTLAEARDYIEVIQSYKLQKPSDEVAQMGDRELQEYIRKLTANKK